MCRAWTWSEWRYAISLPPAFPQPPMVGGEVGPGEVIRVSTKSCPQTQQAAEDLDYSQPLYKGGKTAKQHIIEGHLSGDPSKFRYDTAGGFDAVRRTNEVTYRRGVQFFNPVRGSVEFRLTLPNLSFLPAYPRTGINQGRPTFGNLLVVIPDCKTVVTSYPY